MKFLIYGHNGWIGGQIINLLDELNISYIKGKSRLDSDNNIETEINDVKPTHIMLFTGRTHGVIDGKEYTTIDYLEQKGKLTENIRDNLFSPIKMAILCKKLNIHLTYLGTGCIFEYDEQHPFGEETNGFNENDTPNFFSSSYSIVKGFTDRLMHYYSDIVLNVRIRMPITNDFNKRNFIVKIINYEKICSVPNSMTVLPELLPLIIDMAMKGETGTVNLLNPGLITHNEILEMYREIIDPNFKWKNFTLEEQSKILAGGRSNNYMDTKLLESKYNVTNIKDAVRKCLIDMKNISSN